MPEAHRAVLPAHREQRRAVVAAAQQIIDPGFQHRSGNHRVTRTQIQVSQAGAVDLADQQIGLPQQRGAAVARELLGLDAGLLGPFVSVSGVVQARLHPQFAVEGVVCLEVTRGLLQTALGVASQRLLGEREQIGQLPGDARDVLRR